MSASDNNETNMMEKITILRTMSSLGRPCTAKDFIEGDDEADSETRERVLSGRLDAMVQEGLLEQLDVTSEVTLFYPLKVNVLEVGPLQAELMRRRAAYQDAKQAVELRKVRNIATKKM